MTAVHRDDPALSIEQTTTHDSIFSRGYTVGYVRAKIETRSRFSTDVLTSHLDVLLSLLGDTDAKVTIGEPERRQYSVDWTRLTVEFP